MQKRGLPLNIPYSIFKEDWYEYTLNKIFKYTKIGEDESDCWIWCGTIYPDGKTKIRIGSINISAIRASYLCFIGQIPIHHIIRRSCGNKFCINPNHLQAITPVQSRRMQYTNEKNPKWIKEQQNAAN